MGILNNFSKRGQHEFEEEDEAFFANLESDYDYAEIAEEIHQSVPEAAMIMLHGSRATGTETDTSDHDFLLIVPKDNVPNGKEMLDLSLRVTSLASSLSDKYGIKIDLYSVRPDANAALVAYEEGEVLWAEQQ